MSNGIPTHQTDLKKHNSILDVVPKCTIDDNAQNQNEIFLTTEKHAPTAPAQWQQMSLKEKRQNTFNTPVNRCLPNINVIWLSDKQMKLAFCPDHFSCEKTQFPRNRKMQKGTCTYQRILLTEATNYGTKCFYDLEYAAKLVDGKLCRLYRQFCIVAGHCQ